MARSDMFLKLTGQRTGEIQGESNDANHPNQIELVDWSWGMGAPTAIGGDRTGRVQLRELRVVKHADKSSPALMTVMYRNELLSTALLTVRKAGGQAASIPYFKVTLEQARIADYGVQSAMGPGGAPVLVETIAFTFKKVSIEYTPQGATGGGGGSSVFSGEAGPAS